MSRITNELKIDIKNYSDRQNAFFDGVLYWLSNKPEWEKEIKKLEEQYGIYIYHCVHYYAVYGEILDCLYIPKLDEDFDEELYFEYLNVGIAPIYAINFDREEFSEFGTGRYCCKIGGLSKIN